MEYMTSGCIFVAPSPFHRWQEQTLKQGVCVGIWVPSAQFHGPGFLEGATGRVWNEMYVVSVFVACD